MKIARPETSNLHLGQPDLRPRPDQPAASNVRENLTTKTQRTQRGIFLCAFFASFAPLRLGFHSRLITNARTVKANRRDADGAEFRRDFCQISLRNSAFSASLRFKSSLCLLCVLRAFVVGFAFPPTLCRFRRARFRAGFRRGAGPACNTARPGGGPAARPGPGRRRCAPC